MRTEPAPATIPPNEKSTVEPTVLVLTHPFDPTADYVITELNRRRVPVFRCDPGEFPQNLTLTAALSGGWTGCLRLGERTVHLHEVGCCWYRRPTAFAFPEGMSGPEQAWARREARNGFGGVISALPRWLNHPATIAAAEYKPVQLAAAVAAGLSVPPTLITNDLAAAREFTRAHRRVVYKPLSAIGVAEENTYKMIYTSVVDPADLDDRVSATAHLFQAWMPKAYEVRLTVVDEQMFAARIDAYSEAAAVDWRADYYGHHYSRLPLVPNPVRVGLRRMLRRLRLRFCAADFIVTPAGRWFFLDLNPNGQWAWLEDATGLPIAAAIADALTRG